MLIDLENNIESVSFLSGVYECAVPHQPLSLFLTVLLDTLKHYFWELIKNHRIQLSNAFNNLKEFFNRDDCPVRSVGSETFEYKFIKKLSEQVLSQNDNIVDVWEDCFNQIINSLKTKPVAAGFRRDTSDDSIKDDIRDVLWMMFLLSYCTYPNEQKAFVIDNIEDYIAVKGIDEGTEKPGIPVSNKQIAEIYITLHRFKERIKNAFNEYYRNKRQDFAASVVVALGLRRTTHALLVPFYMGTYEPLYDDIFDVTGDLRFETIWKRKYDTIWGKKLKDNAPTAVKEYVDFANEIILDGTAQPVGSRYNTPKGIPYPQRLMKMMSRGIRRVGHNISIDLYSVYSMLTSGNSNLITPSQYKEILNTNHGHARGMLRQTLIESYYRKQFEKTHEANDIVGERWRFLNIGQIGAISSTKLFGIDGVKTGDKKLKYNTVLYDDGYRVYKDLLQDTPTYHSMLYRILAPLSGRIKTTTSTCVAPEYSEVYLHELLHTVFPDEPTSDELKEFARVLYSASVPERNGDFTPYVLLQCDYEEYTGKETIGAGGYKYLKSPGFIVILRNLWKFANQGIDAEALDSVNPEIYKVRISEGGDDFLHNWLGSFPFYCALYCYNIAPLFFVKNKKIIFHLLWRIYNNAEIQMKFYRHEAALFGSVSDPQHIHPLLITSVTRYDKLIQKLHIDFLANYKAYIEECYKIFELSEEDKKAICSAIIDIIGRYNSEKWNREVPCF